MKLEVEQQLLQAIINYLRTQPWKDVNDLLAALVQCKPREPKKKDKPHGKENKERDV